jgi:hypothetical protein
MRGGDRRLPANERLGDTSATADNERRRPRAPKHTSEENMRAEHVSRADERGEEASAAAAAVDEDTLGEAACRLATLPPSMLRGRPRAEAAAESSMRMLPSLSSTQQGGCPLSSTQQGDRCRARSGESTVNEAEDEAAAGKGEVVATDSSWRRED